MPHTYFVKYFRVCVVQFSEFFFWIRFTYSLTSFRLYLPISDNNLPSWSTSTVKGREGKLANPVYDGCIIMEQPF